MSETKPLIGTRQITVPATFDLHPANQMYGFHERVAQMSFGDGVTWEVLKIFPLVIGVRTTLTHPDAQGSARVVGDTCLYTVNALSLAEQAALALRKAAGGG